MNVRKSKEILLYISLIPYMISVAVPMLCVFAGYTHPNGSAVHYGVQAFTECFSEMSLKLGFFAFGHGGFPLIPLCAAYQVLCMPEGFLRAGESISKTIFLSSFVFEAILLLCPVICAFYGYSNAFDKGFTGISAASECFCELAFSGFIAVPLIPAAMLYQALYIFRHRKKEVL